MSQTYGNDSPIVNRCELIAAVRDSTLYSASRQSDAAVYAALNFIEWRYKEQLTVTMLAKLVHLNPSYLIRMFKEHTGRTPASLIRQKRLEAAAAYMLEGEMQIKDIAEQTGFNSIHYFTRMFTLEYGESPARWRRRMRNLKT